MVSIQPIETPHLNEASPEQNSCREGIKCANGDDGSLVITIERVEHSQSDGHAQRCDKREAAGHEQLLQETDSAEVRDAHAEGKPFEHLMEDYYHDKDSVEGVAGYYEGHTNDWDSCQQGLYQR